LSQASSAIGRGSSSSAPRAASKRCAKSVVWRWKNNCPAA
jgi:hypothetical protein